MTIYELWQPLLSDSVSKRVEWTLVGLTAASQAPTDMSSEMEAGMEGLTLGEGSGQDWKNLFNWHTAVAGEADTVSSLSASACHIGGPIDVNPGQLTLVYGST